MSLLLRRSNLLQVIMASLPLMLASLFFGVPASSAASPGDAEKSIVLIGVTWTGDVQYPAKDGTNPWSKVFDANTFCTGWFASTTGHIVTAGHCVDPQEGRTALIKKFLADNDSENLLSQALGNWKTDGGSEGKPLGRSVQVIQPESVNGAVITKATVAQVLSFKGFDDGDVALLRVSDLGKQTAPLPVASEEPQIGANLTAIGFPASVGAVVDGARLRASFKTGTVSSNQVGPNGVPGTEINADISPGMSGGPTIDDQGRVVGVNSYTLNGESRNFNFITNAGDLATFLKDNNVAITVASAAAVVSESAHAAAPATADVKSTSDGFPWWAVIVGVVVVLLAAAGYVVWRKQRKPALATSAGATNVVSPSGDYCDDSQHHHPVDAQFCSVTGKRIRHDSVS